MCNRVINQFNPDSVSNPISINGGLPVGGSLQTLAYVSSCMPLLVLYDNAAPGPLWNMYIHVLIIIMRHLDKYHILHVVIACNIHCVGTVHVHVSNGIALNTYIYCMLVRFCSVNMFIHMYTI